MKSAQFALALGMLGLGITKGALASPPPGGPGGGKHEPPPFAFEACAGKTEGDDCTVPFHDESKQGSCLVFRDQRLLCVPDDMPPPPSGDRPSN